MWVHYLARESQKECGVSSDTSGRTPGTPARNPSVEEVGSEFACRICCQALYRSLSFIFIETSGDKSFLFSSNPLLSLFFG